MPREKQIEEIAKVICGGCPDNKECMHCLCADWYKAESIYNAGYRKQSEIAREIFEMIEKCMEHDYISSVGVYNGALELRIAELKKKYIWR